MQIPVLYLVVPCYNEEDVLLISSALFYDELDYLIENTKIDNESRILFVDDGSKDSTWKIIQQLSGKNEHYIGIKLSRNSGQQNALLAGLMEAKKYCDIAITIDSDGQDDIKTIEDMIDAYDDGCDVVYGVRSSRKKDSFLKKTSAECFYRFMNCMGTETVYNHSEYRLMSKRVLNELSKYKEVNLFLRGMIPLIGFKSTSVYYERKERLAGKSKYSVGKLFSLAVDGITSLSTKPLQIIMVLGCLLTGLSLLGLIGIITGLILKASVGDVLVIVCIICLMGGIQMICLGIVGEYVGKTYMETKRRPRYVISDRTYEKENGEGGIRTHAP